MARGRLAKFWMAALLLAVALSVAAAATTVSPATAESDVKDNTAPADGTKDDGTTDDGGMAQNDGMADDDGMAQDDGGMQDQGQNDAGADADSGETDDQKPAGAEAEQEDEVPTGGSAGAEADAAVGDDVEEPVEDEAEAGDDGDEGKAGTGKRSVEDKWNELKGKASGTWKETREKLKGMYKKYKDKIKNAIESWSDKIKSKFNGLSDDVKAKIFASNFTGLKEEEINTLNKNQLRLLVPMNRLAGLNSTIQERVYQRFKSLNDGQSMRRVLETLDVGDRADFITKISEVKDKLGNNEMAKKRLVMSMIDKLGDPRNWTVDEVELMRTKQVLNYIPPAKLLRLNETASVAKVSIPSTTQIRDLKPAAQKAWADFIVHKKAMSKNVSEWAAADISTSIKDSLGRASLETLKMIKNDSLYDAFASQPSTSAEFERAQGRILAQKLMSEFKKKTANPTPAQIKSFAATRLARLISFVQPDELVQLVDSSLTDNEDDIKDLLRSTFAKKNAARSKRCEVFKRLQKDVNLATLQRADVERLVSQGTLSCVPLKYLSKWIMDGMLLDSQIKPGVLTPGQLRALARTASALEKYKKTGASGGLDLGKLPAVLTSAAAASDIKNTEWSTLRTRISSGAMLDRAQRHLAVSKATPAQIVDADLGAEYAELVPVADLKTMTAAKKKMAAMNSPPDSPLRMLSAADPETALPASITASDVANMFHPGLPYTDVGMVAERISTDDIQEVLEKFREEEDKGTDPSGGMSRKMCGMMKMLLANATQLQVKDDDDDTSILGSLTGTELASQPPCVVGGMKYDSVKDKATADQKVGILSSLSQLKPAQLKMMNKRNGQGLVREALKAMKSSGDLMVDQADMVGMAAPFMDASDIKRLDMPAFNALKMYFQDGCLDKAQADAIVNRLITHYGRPSTWTDVESVCGLLPLMDDSDLREINETHLAAACGGELGEDEDDSFERFENTAQMLCGKELSNSDYKLMMDRRANMVRRVAGAIRTAQKELMDVLNTTETEAAAAEAAAATRRRRRSVESKLTCALVEQSNSGAEPWTESQLNGMDTDEVKMCQKALGSKMTDDGKLRTIWSKLKAAYMNDAGKVPMKDIGYTVSVIPVDDIKKLNLSTYDAISAVGRPVEMSKEQLMELAKRAMSEYSGLSGDSSGYVADDLVAAGQLICGMEPDKVAQIPSAQIKPAMKTLSEVQWCNMTVAEKLAAKSLELNGGDPANLGKAEVAEMGAVLGGLSAMDLKKIKPEAMEGMTESGMMSIPPSKIAVLSAEQIGGLGVVAAISVSDEQMDKLPDDSKKALKKVLQDVVSEKPGGGAEHVTGALLPLLLLALAVTRLS